MHSFDQSCSMDLCVPSWEEGTEQETFSTLQKFNLVEDKCQWIEDYSAVRLKASDEQRKDSNFESQEMTQPFCIIYRILRHGP